MARRSRSGTCSAHRAAGLPGGVARIAGRSPPPPPAGKTPRPHSGGGSAGRRWHASNDIDRGQLVMACGTGKTLAALSSPSELASKRTLVLVPSLSLLAQTLREWIANARDPIRATWRSAPTRRSRLRTGTPSRPAHRRARPAGHHRPRRRSRPSSAATAARFTGRVRHLPVLTADRRGHDADRASRPSTSRSPTRRTAAPGRSAGTSPRSSTPTRSGHSGGCS